MWSNISGSCSYSWMTTNDNTIHKVEAALLEDCCITIWQLAQEVEISVGSIEKRSITTILHMWKLFARWIPQMLTHFQKQEGVNCFQALLAMCQENEEDYFGRLIIQDETCVYHYDPEVKVQKA
ncbi:uncharacterized protein LOC106869680 [Octopus bimaculoides]|uniref:uncharacterized protein LOC106869680 n=1 Tax=Octopus bimaculoides TaxID=37653 RepID=UPI00071CDDC8|nr:uncharacterized protein LOC106869680 [Octopus bimaculoides]|eukprot:XP_014770993.1 PREDICTED: uncharacterized protein LOC106869680 [Octopus bimaculoides]